MAAVAKRVEAWHRPMAEHRPRLCARRGRQAGARPGDQGRWWSKAFQAPGVNGASLEGGPGAPARHTGSRVPTRPLGRLLRSRVVRGEIHFGDLHNLDGPRPDRGRGPVRRRHSGCLACRARREAEV